MKKIFVWIVLFTFLTVACGKNQSIIDKQPEVGKEVIETETVNQIGEDDTAAETESLTEVQNMEIDEELKLYIRSVLAAVGDKTMDPVSEISEKDTADIILTMLDIPYLCYDTADYIPYLTEFTNDSEYFITDEDLAYAAKTILGHEIHASECIRLEDYAGYRVQSEGIYRLANNGRGKWNDIAINDIYSEGDEVYVDYTFIRYDHAEASDSRTPSYEQYFKAEFTATGSSDYPLQLMRVTYEDGTSDYKMDYKDMYDKFMSQEGAEEYLADCMAAYERFLADADRNIGVAYWDVDEDVIDELVILPFEHNDEPVYIIYKYEDGNVEYMTELPVGDYHLFIDNNHALYRFRDSGTLEKIKFEKDGVTTEKIYDDIDEDQLYNMDFTNLLFSPNYDQK